jgi:predicted LPLAT superfamily acyltransferase
MADTGNRQWSGKTDGQTWMLKSLIFMFKWMNIRILYGVMACVIPFYMLFSRKAYRAAYSYFRERHGCTPFRSFINVYLSQYTFGQVILDRFAC